MSWEPSDELVKRLTKTVIAEGHDFSVGGHTRRVLELAVESGELVPAAGDNAETILYDTLIERDELRAELQAARKVVEAARPLIARLPSHSTADELRFAVQLYDATRNATEEQS